MKEQKLVRYIEIYDKKTEFRVSKIELPKKLNLNDLKVLFKVEDNDPDMVYGYNITQNHVDYLENLICKRLDLNRYDYQIACYKNDS
jgi:hypothetical protein